MAKSANDLIVGLGADLKSLERELKRAGVLANNAVNDIEDRFARANPKLNFGALRVGFAALAAGLVTGLVAALAEANRSLLEMDKTARLANISLRELQELQFAGAKVGISGGDVNSGISGLAKALNEARREENELTRLLDANNIKWKDRKGEVIGVNDALRIAAELIQRAGTEADKLDIAKKMSIPENLIPMLERGAGQLAVLRQEAQKSGAIIDDAIIAKAREFDRAWSESVTSLTANWKAGILQMAYDWSQLLKDAVIKAQQFGKDVRAALDPNGAARSAGASVGAQIGAARANPFGNMPSTFSGPVDERLQRQLNELYKTSTKIPSKPDRSGGGGGGGLTDEEQRYNQVVNYIEVLERQGRILEAEVASIGKSNAERAKAIELARIGTVTDEEQLRLIDQAVAKNEQLRQKLEEARKARQGLFSAANFAGDQLLDVFDAAIDKSRSLEDAIQGVVKALIKAALQAAILGQGPLAGLMGMSGTGGAPGGLVGGIISGFRATGGPVQSGKTYVVGENGPEMVRFGKNGQVIPNSLIGGGGAGGGIVVNNIVENHAGAQVEQRQERGQNGEMVLRTIIKSVMLEDIGKNGDFSKALQGRYGLNRARGR